MEAVKKMRSSEQIVDYILEQLSEKKLVPGDRLPNERELSESLGVSRVPLREAICALSLLGIVRSRQGSGSYIEHYKPEMLAKAMYMYSLLDSISMDELFEMRAFVEAEAARLAAERATDDDIVALRTALSQGDNLLRTPSKVTVDAETSFYIFNQFHRHIARCSHNRFLQHFADSIRLLARRYHVIGFQNNPEIFEQLTASHEGHRTLFRLIAARDGERAYETARAHLDFEYHCIRDVIQLEGAADVDLLHF